MDQWYILYDIPYQKDFVGYYELQVIDDGQWYILNDIPYQKKFKALSDVTEHPVHEGMWKILTDIPYQPDFVTYYSLQPLADPTWYILQDIPYKKEFPQLSEITDHPLHAGMWKILTDIPYQPEFPPYIALQPLEVGTWYILNDIPYQKDFSRLIGITDTPSHPDIWHILEDIPYQPRFPDYYELSSWSDPWYILHDIPYKKDFAELQDITAVPGHAGKWYILEDIPYQKQFPEWYGLGPLQEQWYILNDIPYKKEFPELSDVDETPKHPGQWYILSDIPYQKPFVAYYAIQPLPEQWYILNDIPYKKEFPELRGITAKPKHAGWRILYDIPYRKEFPPLYSVTAIPKHYTPKSYMVVGVSVTGRWQVRTCPEYDTSDWTLIEDLGPTSAVMSACIEADGDFDYIAGDESITLTTEDTPWMAVITTTKKLYVKQVCADISTAQLIDTGVEEAALCRGWKSTKYNVDAGLILVYRKFQGVFIRRYREVGGEMVWEVEDPLLAYDYCTHIEVKRLNDYRIAVFVDNPNRVLLTDRYYIGGTAKTEYIDVKATSWINIATAHTVDEPEAQDFTFLTATIENSRFIRVHGRYPICSIDRDVTNVTLTDSYHHSTMVSYTISNGDILIEMDKPKLNAYNLLTVIFSDANHIKYIAGASRTGVVPGQSISVENKFVPDEYVNLTATATVGELVAVEKQQYNISMLVESVVLSVDTTVSELSTTPLNKMVVLLPTESVVFNVGITVSELTATQSGDLPV